MVVVEADEHPFNSPNSIPLIHTTLTVVRIMSLREVVWSSIPVRRYCGPFFLPQIANAI